MQNQRDFLKSKEWNSLDRMLSWWRTRKIMSYIKKEDIVCDIGCGQNGLFLRSIAKKIKKGDGFDLKLKKERVHSGNVHLYRDFFDPQKDTKYDGIFMFAVLEHLHYPNEVECMMEKIFKSIEIGGFFIMTTPDKRARKLLEFLAYQLHVINEEEIRDHKHYFDKKELVTLMKKMGFKKVKHEYFQLGLNNRIIAYK